MAYVAADLETAMVNAMNADKPVALTNNGLIDNLSTDSRWTNSTLSGANDGTTSGIDVAHTDFPLAGLSDGNLLRGSKASTAGQTDQYCVLAFSSPITIDALFLKIIGMDTSAIDVDVQIADNAAFSTNLITIAKFVGLPGGNTSSRLLGLRLCNHASLDDTPQSYSGVDYMRIKISRQSGSHGSAPHIAELFAGPRRQLARGSMRPQDELPYASDVDMFRGDGRKRQTYVRASGYSDLEFNYMVAEADQFGLSSNDLVVGRGIFTDVGYGCRPFPFVQKPSSDPYRTRVVRYEEPILNLQNVAGGNLREQAYLFLEDPPFYTADTAWTALAISTSSLSSHGDGVPGYSEQLACSGGSSSGYESYSIASGSLPSGLSMTDAGLITGTPSGAGTYNLTFRARDVSNATATRALSITIT